MFTTVMARHDEGVATLTFKSHDGLHVLSKSTLQALLEALDRLSTQPNIYALVLRGEGTRAFSAGANLRELAGFDQAAARAYSAFGQEVTMALARFPAMTLAALNGPAFGGGIELALACDFRLAHTDSRLHYQASLLGVLPGWGGTQRLPHWVGRQKANAMMLLCEPIGPATALAWGLVDDVGSCLDTLLGAWLTRLAPLDRFASLQLKRAMDQAVLNNFVGEQEAFAACFADKRANARILEWLQRAKMPPGSMR
jgi:enoyl-CoA hydratase/carnithine racemase